ncbi:MAG: hypothetical protein V4563_14070 [Pseudomonadota bacterium]
MFFRLLDRHFQHVTFELQPVDTLHEHSRNGVRFVVVASPEKATEPAARLFLRRLIHGVFAASKTLVMPLISARYCSGERTRCADSKSTLI